MQIKILFSFIILTILSFNLNAQLKKVPSVPDYNNLYYWAAHPEKESPALAMPGKDIEFTGELLEVDIFYIHPTSYTQKEKKTWNADLYDKYLNENTDGYVIKNQASVFNVVGEIYAPRYRQAHISAYGLKNTTVKQEIFQIAYEDVKAAFEHYLRLYNLGKPFILATHSQGTTHGKRLVKELIDKDEELRSRMVAAYLVGMDVKKNEFDNIGPCNSPNETGCFTSWRTIRKNKETPNHYPAGDEYVATNPLTWDDDEKVGHRALHLGAIFLFRFFSENLIITLLTIIYFISIFRKMLCSDLRLIYLICSDLYVIYIIIFYLPQMG